MNVIKLQKKYPQFKQNEIFGLQDAFRKLDVDDKGYLDEATVVKATQTSERQPYDVVRQALKEVELDSSRRVELDDYVDVGFFFFSSSSFFSFSFFSQLASSDIANMCPAHCSSSCSECFREASNDYWA